METEEKPILLILKNYICDNWTVVDHYSPGDERVLLKTSSYQQAKDFYDAERAKRGA